MAKTTPQTIGRPARRHAQTRPQRARAQRRRDAHAAAAQAAKRARHLALCAGDAARPGALIFGGLFFSHFLSGLPDVRNLMVSGPVAGHHHPG